MTSRNHQTVSTWLAHFLIHHRWFILTVIAICTCILALLIPRIGLDLSLQTMLVTSSAPYRDYALFHEIFGEDEFVLVAIKNNRPISQQRMLTAIDRMTSQLDREAKITDVLSITNLTIFQKGSDHFGNYGVVTSKKEAPSLPVDAELAKMRQALPVIDLLLSSDRNTAGIVIRIDNRWKYDDKATKAVLAKIAQVVKAHLIEGQEFRVVGGPVVKAAFAKYSMRSVVRFVICCTIICIAVTTFMFRSAKITMATIGILGICSFWVLGLMPVLGIRLTSITSLCPGLVLIQTLEFVIQVVTRFRQFRQWEPDHIDAGRETLRFLMRPCFICAATTAVGYGASMVSDIPCIYEMGLLMTVGSIVSFALAMILATSLMIYAKSLGLPLTHREGPAPESKRIEFVIDLISKHYRLFTVAGILLALLVSSGIPFIRVDPQLVNDLGRSSPEVKDIRFVESNLSSVYYMELLLQCENEGLRKGETWKVADEVEKKIRAVPRVIAAESVLPAVRYMHDVMRKESANQEDLLAHPQVIPQLIFVMSSSESAERNIRRYLDADFTSLRISIRIRRASSATMPETIHAVRAAVNSVINESPLRGSLTAVITGAPVLEASLGKYVVKSQLHALALAVVLITAMMMMQMGSVRFGLISLIPNIPPMATVFGVIGWAGIPLGAVNMGAATVALGLAVDNTIQFVAQLRRETDLNPHLGVSQCMFRAYRNSARPIVAWSMVITLGFLSILTTPFQSAREFGTLVAAAMIMGMFGDLVFMQSIILTFSPVRRLIRKIVSRR